MASLWGEWPAVKVGQAIMLAWLIGALIIPLLIIISKVFVRLVQKGQAGASREEIRQVFPEAVKRAIADRDILVYAVTVLVSSASLLSITEAWVFLLFLIPIAAALIVYGSRVGHQDELIEERALNAYMLLGVGLTALAWLSAIIAALFAKASE